MRSKGAWGSESYETKREAGLVRELSKHNAHLTKVCTGPTGRCVTKVGHHTTLSRDG